jgi:catechol 2,3-dioxygenase-like lactoylglutathione lyase family enzyme
MQAPSRIDHVAVIVSDLDRSMQFYENILGLKPLYSPPRVSSGVELSKAVNVPNTRMRFVMYEVNRNSAMLEVIQYLDPKGRPNDRRNCDQGVMHLAFQVSNLEKSYNEMKSKGVKFNSPPNKVDSGPEKGLKWVYLTDPDGATIELVEHPRE